MSWVTAKPGETIDSLLRRFKKAVENAGILSDLKKNEYYEKPSVKKKRKREAARKRAIKLEQKLARQRARKNNNKNFKWNKDRTKKIPMPPPKKYVPKEKRNNRVGDNKPVNRNNTTQKGRTNYNKNHTKGFTKRPRYVKKDG